MPTISVIVPHYSDLQGLDVCLTALHKQSYPCDDFEIIVADNASPVGEGVVTEVISGRAQLVIATKRGAGPARNAGVAASVGTFLAFIDSDCRPEPDWLAEGVRALATYDFVGGRVRVLVEDLNHLTSTEAFERVFAFDFKRYVLRKGFAGTGNLFCKRAVFDHVGGFLSGVSEDVDWSSRARAAGYRIGYAPNAVVGHPARKTWQELRDKWKRVTAETYHLHLARRRGRFRWLLRSCALPLSALAHSPRVLASPELHSVHQRFLALGALYRIRMWRFWESIRVVRKE